MSWIVIETGPGRSTPAGLIGKCSNGGGILFMCSIQRHNIQVDNVFYQKPTPKDSKVQRGEGPGDSTWLFRWFHQLFCEKICSSFGSANVPQLFISSHPASSNVCLLQFGTFKEPNNEVGSVHVHHVVLRVHILSTSLSFETTLKLPSNLASLLGCNLTSVLKEV